MRWIRGVYSPLDHGLIFLNFFRSFEIGVRLPAQTCENRGMVSEHQQVVELQRSVRYGRLLIGGAVVGGVIGALATTFFPIAEGSLYSLGQIAGFMLLVGAVIGLAVGGILSLGLTLVARRNHGTGVVSIETGSDAQADAAAPRGE